MSSECDCPQATLCRAEHDGDYGSSGHAGPCCEHEAQASFEHRSGE